MNSTCALIRTFSNNFPKLRIIRKNDDLLFKNIEETISKSVFPKHKSQAFIFLFDKRPIDVYQQKQLRKSIMWEEYFKNKYYFDTHCKLFKRYDCISLPYGIFYNNYENTFQVCYDNEEIHWEIMDTLYNTE